MKHNPLALAAAALAAAAAHAPAPALAAGLERAAPSTRVLFRDGTYLEFNLTHVRPDLSGRGADLSALGQDVQIPGRTGDLLDSYTQLGLAAKGDITDRIAYAVILDEPWGADTSYGQGSFPDAFSYAGTSADLDSYAVTGMLGYHATPRVTLFGGLRAQRTEATAAVPFIGPTADPPLPGYTVRTGTDWGLGYMLGAAYRMPEIALRVALSYHSRIEHTFDTREFGLFDTRTTIETPQSVNLEFQSGVAEDTLVFGSVRWVDWSSFTIAPPAYVQATGRPLVDYHDDWWTYTLGVGYRFDDTLSGAVQASHEPAVGGQVTTLGPVDGRTVLGGSLTYTTGDVELTGGLSYGWLGSTHNVLQTRYSGGTFTALGLRVGYAF